jgi:hypothetical protein
MKKRDTVVITRRPGGVTPDCAHSAVRRALSNRASYFGGSTADGARHEHAS